MSSKARREASRKRRRIAPQEETVAALLTSAFADAASAAVHRFETAANVVVAAGPEDTLSSIPAADLVDDAFLDGILDEVEETLVEMVAAEAGSFGAAFNVTDPRVASIASQRIGALEGIAASARTQLSASVQIGIENGWPIRKIAAHLAESGPFTAASATSWAQGIVVGAANEAHQLSYSDVAEDGDEKEWVSAFDARPSHLAANGQRVLWDGYFDVNGHSASHPGDTALPMEELVNCRCTSVLIRSDGGVRRSKAAYSAQTAVLAASTPPRKSGPWTAAVVTFLPTGPFAIAQDDGIQAEELHVTGLYLGEFGSLAPMAAALAPGQLEKLAARTAQIVVEDMTIKYLGDEELRDSGWVAVVAAFPDTAVAEFEAVHTELDSIFDALGAPNQSNFDTYLPHLTLGYWPEDYAQREYPEGSSWAPTGGGPVTFGGLGFWAGEDRSAIYPFPSELSVKELPAMSKKATAAGVDELGGLLSPEAPEGTTVVATAVVDASEVADPENVVIPDSGASSIGGGEGASAAADAADVVIPDTVPTEWFRNLEPGAVVATGAEGEEIAMEWEAVLVLEGIETGDKRMMQSGSLTWVVPPLPLFGQFFQAYGHDGAGFIGSIRQIVRDGNVIIGRGVYDTGEYGQNFARMIGEETVGGISVDLDSVKAELLLDDAENATYDEYVQAVTLFTAGRIRGATVCGIAAFSQAFIMAIDPEDSTDELLSTFPAARLMGHMPKDFSTDEASNVKALAASAASTGSETMIYTPYTGSPLTTVVADAGINPMFRTRDGARTMLTDDQRARLMCPEPAVFAPELVGPQPFTVNPDGTMMGHIGLNNSCHTGRQDKCVPVPESATNYSAFHGERDDIEGGPHIICADGSRVNVGRVFADTVHPSLELSASDAYAWYADTGSCGGYLRAYRTEWGVAVAGVCHPDITDAQLFSLRASQVSGDWRPLGGGLELLAVLSVNTGGFNQAVTASAGKPVVDVPTGGGVFRSLVASSGRVLALVGGSDTVAAMECFTAAKEASIEERLAALETLALRQSLTASAESLGLDAPDFGSPAVDDPEGQAELDAEMQLAAFREAFGEPTASV